MSLFWMLLQVLDVYPLPGLVVSPPEGVVPMGGRATLEIHFIPDSVIKFDTRVEVGEGLKCEETGLINFLLSRFVCVCVLQIALRNMKSIELRVGGSVEPPNVDFSVVSLCYKKTCEYH